jgi:hypothetical protein
MALKITQNYKLATLLQSGEQVTVEKIMETLGISKISVAVYIFDLRKKHKADIENIKDGNKVVAYRLKNKIDVPQYRSNNNQIEKKVDGNTVTVVADSSKDGGGAPFNTPILDQDNVVTTISDRDMADLHDQLGLNENGSNFNLD